VCVAGVPQGPDRVEEIDAVLRSMQNGDIKLRVRALEAERALVRVAAVQKAQTQVRAIICIPTRNAYTVFLPRDCATIWL
jgi:hypothetical protein